MANLDSLGYASITDESRTEALERLRVLRLNRRTPLKIAKPKSTAAASTKTKNAKAKLSLSESDKLELLKLILGENK
jgi:hypothetical protein